jgi:alanine racemase
VLHLCNSPATLTRPQDHFDLVRCGIALYGLDPGQGLIADVPLRPALRWCSRVSLVKRLAAGEAVSYGHRWMPESDTTVGTVPAGYADGVTRLLGGLGAVVVGGRRRPMVGRVCMDQFLFDAGDDRIAVGDEVVLIGAQGDAAVTADDWATWLDTINYEIVCGVGQRVPRVYVDAD